MDTLQRIGEMFSNLSKGKQKIAKYILENNEEAAFSPAISIAKAVGMSESAVVRLATDLGFSGYKEMQESLQKTLKGTP
jgi:DNA-binding MurR/RpiR family transcriptional regulator